MALQRFGQRMTWLRMQIAIGKEGAIVDPESGNPARLVRAMTNRVVEPRLFPWFRLPWMNGFPALQHRDKGFDPAGA